MTSIAKLRFGLTDDELRLFKRQLAAIFIVITLLNLGFYLQRAHRELTAKRNVQLMMQGWDGLAWYVWMPAAPATLLLIRRYPLDKDRRARVITGLVAGSAAIYLVVTNARYLLRWMPNLWLPPELDRPAGWDVYWATQLDRTPLDFLTYCGLFAASFAVDYYSKYRYRMEQVLRLELSAAQLQSDLARAQLAALRGQLHPHFLFNAFNSVSALVRQHRHEAAVEMIANLGDLFRSAIERVELQESRLRDEIEFTTCYLKVERVRFGKKLQHRIDVPPQALDATVPHFLLQPLVENAVKHGISRRTTEGLIDISAARRGDRLVLVVSNDGAQLPGRPARTSAGGLGLKNTRSRLEHAYGADFRLDVSPREDGGMTVTIDLPWRAPAAAFTLPAETVPA